MRVRRCTHKVAFASRARDPKVVKVMPFIYALADPSEPDHVRYVGMAMRDARPFDHVKEARKGKTSYCYNWIRSLLTRNIEPIVFVIERCADDTLRSFVGERERYHIGRLRNSGHQLTNTADGGYGGMMIGKHHTDEAKAKISFESRTRVRKPFSDAARMKMRLSKLGKRRPSPSAETRAKMSMTQKGRPYIPLSAESRAKLSASVKKSWTRRRGIV